MNSSEKIYDKIKNAVSNSVKSLTAFLSHYNIDNLILKSSSKLTKESIIDKT
jgi:hypothetical protein